MAGLLKPADATSAAAVMRARLALRLITLTPGCLLIVFNVVIKDSRPIKHLLVAVCLLVVFQSISDVACGQTAAAQASAGRRLRLASSSSTEGGEQMRFEVHAVDSGDLAIAAFICMHEQGRALKRFANSGLPNTRYSRPSREIGGPIRKPRKVASSPARSGEQHMTPTSTVAGSSR